LLSRPGSIRHIHTDREPRMRETITEPLPCRLVELLASHLNPALRAGLAQLETTPCLSA
jgi:hypothetical protein